MPSYNKGINVGTNSNYTAPSNGILFISGWGGNNSASFRVLDKTTNSRVVWTEGALYVGGCGACQCLLVAGHVYDIYAFSEAIFYPCQTTTISRKQIIKY